MDLAERIAKDRALLDRLGVLAADPAALTMQVAEDMVNARGFCHGGLLFALADTACAYALGARGVSPATVDASITYLQAARLGDSLTARAEVLRAGRRFGHCEVRITRADGALLATYRGTCVNLSDAETAPQPDQGSSSPS